MTLYDIPIPVSFTICPKCNIKIGLCGLGIISYELCPKCKNMKIEDLKVGDRIKHSHGTSDIFKIFTNYVNTSYGDVYKKDIISKLEPTYKEIAIEHPAPKVYKLDLVNILSVDLEVNANQYRDFSPRFSSIS